MLISNSSVRLSLHQTPALHLTISQLPALSLSVRWQPQSIRKSALDMPGCFAHVCGKDYIRFHPFAGREASTLAKGTVHQIFRAESSTMPAAQLP